VVPLVRVRFNQVFYKCVLTALFLFTPNLEAVLGGEPIILPNVDLITIANGPKTASLKNPISLEDTSPSVTHVISDRGIQKIALRKVLCLKNSGHQRFWLGENSSTLLCQ
jgi:hypothetical protein